MDASQFRPDHAPASTAPKVAAGWHLCLDVAELMMDGAPTGPIVGASAMDHGWSELHELGMSPHPFPRITHPVDDRLRSMTDDVHALRPVGLEFLGSAPHRFEYAEPLAAPPAAVFAAISADPSTWSWFPGVDEGSYEGADSPGIGTRRWVRVGGVKYRETMLAWDQHRRWAYRVDETSSPVFAALAEDWVMEPAAGDTTVLRWTFAFDPLPETAELMVGARELIGTTFHDAARGLDTQLR